MENIDNVDANTTDCYHAQCSCVCYHIARLWLSLYGLVGTVGNIIVIVIVCVNTYVYLKYTNVYEH